MQKLSILPFLMYFRVLFNAFFLSLPLFLFAQVPGSLRIVSPAADSSTVAVPRIYFRGMAALGSELSVNGKMVDIYKTGAFAMPVDLSLGINELQVIYKSGSETSKKQLIIRYEKPAPLKATEGFAIESVKIRPAGELWLQEGDRLQLEIKATPGMKASFYKGIPLFEADEQEVGVKGVYRGEYILKETDTLSGSLINVHLEHPVSKEQIVATSADEVTLMRHSHALTGLVTGQSAFMAYGLGADRLGGARLGNIDTLVKLEITGKMQDMYRVRLADQIQAYIPIDDVRLQEGIHYRPYSLTGSWSVTADGKYDQVHIGLDERLPYSSVQQISPTRLAIDIYGAVSNSNWITQKQGLKIIKNVWYEQTAKDVFRVYIELNKQQLWGYDVFYQGKSLNIRVKQQPPVLKLNKLTIGVDAGHGGTNRGAVGLTGQLEKELNLSMALKLKHQLEKEGASVVITRQTDTLFNNADRVHWMKAQNPDILVSIHCNASGSPATKGASTYYRHVAYRRPSQFILTEMLKLGLDDFGNVGGFNFMFNAPTTYPSVLVETGFLSNPEDEARLVDPAFQDELAKSIVKGLKNFLKEVTKDNKRKNL